MRAQAPHHARVGLHDQVAQAAAVEDLAVRALVSRVGLLKGRRVGIERIGVLHQEFARAEHARARPRLVALLGLDLVPDLRQVAVRPDLTRGEPRDHLFVGHAEAHVAAVPVLQAEHLPADRLPPAGLLPELGRLEHGHRDLLATDRVHLLADDGVDLVEHALAEGKVDVDAGGELTDEASAEHESVADRLRVGGDFPQRRDQ